MQNLNHPEIKEEKQFNKKRLQTLDSLFHTPIKELLKFSVHELHERKEAALLLVNCLDSIARMKKDEAVKEHG